MSESPRLRHTRRSVSGGIRNDGPTLDFKTAKRQATVYDAVAGRVSSAGFIQDAPRFSKYRDTVSSTKVAVPPEEVLFRRRGAPERFAEDDVYWADRHLTELQKLPDSDLLKAIHVYAADFYRRATSNKGIVDFESLDETALLALGILLEEMSKHVLGTTGDLAFVEGEETDEVIGEPGAEANKTEDYTQATVDSPAAQSQSENSTGAQRKTKKRKLIHHESDAG